MLGEGLFFCQISCEGAREQKKNLWTAAPFLTSPTETSLQDLHAEIGFANRGSRLRFVVGSGRVGSEVLGSVY